MSLVSIINELAVDNVENSIKFYEHNFQFTTELTEGTPITWAQLRKDNVIIMLEEYKTVKKCINNYPEKLDSSNLIKFEYNNLQEVNELYEIFKQNDIEFFMEYTKTDYGKAEFGILDPDKNMIVVSALI